MEIVKWNRYFALYDQEELVCVTVYKKGAQEVKTMARALFGLELECVISRIAAILDRSKRPILRVGSIGLIEGSTRSRNLISIHENLKVGSLGTHIGRCNQNLAG